MMCFTGLIGEFGAVDHRNSLLGYHAISDFIDHAIILANSKITKMQGVNLVVILPRN